MKGFKTSLTHLVKQIENKLPDGDNVLGYPGVSRAALIAAVNNAYDLAQEIKPSDEDLFEVISLKRAGSAINARLHEFLDSSKDEEKKKKAFNDFLDDLALLLEKTKITYFIVAKGGLRDDSELAQIRKRLSDLAVVEKEYSSLIESVKEDVEFISKGAETTKIIYDTVEN